MILREREEKPNVSALGRYLRMKKQKESKFHSERKRETNSHQTIEMKRKKERDSSKQKHLKE